MRAPAAGASIRIAALPMYDFPELREAHDQLWTVLAQRLLASGVASVPRQLTRRLSHREAWAHPGLLFGQACEYPLYKSFPEGPRILATPRYRAPGCTGTFYRSAILVRAHDPAGGLDDLRNRRCVVNEPDSNSGVNLFRAALAPLADGRPIFQSVHFSGSHHKSMELLAKGEADVTAVDCVTLAHLKRLQPQLASQLRIVEWTPASPCLPFITSCQTSEPIAQALRSAIAEVVIDPELSSARDLLLLKGVDLQPDTTFGRVRELELEAQCWRYGVLS